jgi:hypothetical protein
MLLLHKVAAQTSKSSWVPVIGTRLNGETYPVGIVPLVGFIGAEAIAFLLRGVLKSAMQRPRQGLNLVPVVKEKGILLARFE